MIVFRRASVFTATALWCLWSAAGAQAKPAAVPDSKKESKPEAQAKASKPAKPQMVCLAETETTSPRHSLLKDGPAKDPSQVIRIDLDNDGDPDVIEQWWNGKRARWFDENDDMTSSDIQGDQVDDSVQIDRDGDGFYDGPGDMNIDWVDDDGDGDADLQVVAMNPRASQPSVATGESHYMIFEDVDDDNVHGYVDWKTFEFPCWRATNSTAYPMPDLKTNFSPDYHGNSIFLKEHLPAFSIEDPRYSWENPFAFYDFDNDGVSEMAMRFCDGKIKNPGGEETGWKYDGKIEEAFVSYDLDNDSQRGNEMDFDMSMRFSGGERLDYSRYVHKHPKLKAPQWALPYFRYTNWRSIDELVYVPHDKCYEEFFKPKWENAYFTFDEDDDDHRWERVEIYYPGNPYSVERWKKGYDTEAGLCGHPQSDTLGDRGEYDTDFSGKGQLYIGRWDKKIHLYGAEWGAWTVDYGAKYWGSSPVMGDSSPAKAPKVEEVVQYRDTDNNGFIDEIRYDYDGDKNIDLTVNLLAYKDAGTSQGGDAAEIISPADQKWQGMHELFGKISEEAWQDALKVYRGVWKKGLSTAELDDLAIASSTAEKYDHAYWLKEKIFRMLDRQLASQPEMKDKRAELQRLYFTGNIAGLVEFISAQSWKRGDESSTTSTVEADLAGPYSTTAAKPAMKQRTELMRQLEPLMFQQAKYLISTLKPWQKDPQALSLTPCGSGEHDIRPNTHTIYGLAVMYRAIKEGYPAGLSPEICRDKAIAMLRFVLATHGAGGQTCNNGKQWKGQWQSALWANMAGKAAWLLWDELDPQTRWLAARMVCDEADRFLNQTPPAQVINDTKAEENAWDALIIGLAYNMFPKHPHHEAWGKAAYQWAVSAFARPEDLKDDTLYEGRPLRQWLSGANIYSDFTLENHNRVHPDYMNTFDMNLYQALVYEWGGNKLPKGFELNCAGIFGSLKKLYFPDASFLYPNGQDWGLHRNPHWIWTHAAMAVLLGDPDADRMMRMAIDCTALMAKRTPDSGIHAPEEYSFPSTQQFLFEMFGDIYLLLAERGDGPAPTAEKELWHKLEGLHLFEAGKFGVMRSENAVATFSWGAQVLGMVLPMQRDLLISPYERSLIGSMRVEGMKSETPRVRQVKLSPSKDVLGVSGIVERAGGAIEQRFGFVALPDGRTLYVEALRQTSQTKLLSLELAPLAVLNEARWVYHEPKRTLYSQAGQEVFSATAKSEKVARAMSSPWYNIDDALGIVCLAGSGKQSYLANTKSERGRVEQLFTLNAVDASKLAGEPGKPLAQTAIVFYPKQEHEATSKVAGKCQLQQNGAKYEVSLEDGKKVSVDLDALSVEVR